MAARPSNTEVQAQIDEADAHVAEGVVQWPGMSYEEGVSAALRWVLGQDPELPMSD